MGKDEKLKNYQNHSLRPSLSRRYTVNEADLEQSYINTRFCALEMTTIRSKEGPKMCNVCLLLMFSRLKKIRRHSRTLHCVV